MSTTADGMHRDVPIVHVEKHPAYNISGDAKNDIMILYLKYDIEINGTIEVYFSIQRNMSSSMEVFIVMFHVTQIECVRYVYLSKEVCEMKVSLKTQIHL